MLRFLPSPAHSLGQIGLCDLLPARKVARGDLGVNLDARVRRDEFVLLEREGMNKQRAQMKVERVCERKAYRVYRISSRSEFR